jgi:stage IV sporulation protein FB
MKYRQMTFRLHPILLPILLFFLVTGGFSMYALVLLSLIIHECGHLFVAIKAGMRVQTCTILPYGGELTIHNIFAVPKKDRLYLALGGPIATLLLLLLAIAFPFPGHELFIQIQIALILLNLLPILPLDGGQVLLVLLERENIEEESRTIFLVFSICACITTITILCFALPTTTPYVFLAIFLLIQNISRFRYRKYEKAFRKIVLNRLTE